MTIRRAVRRFFAHLLGIQKTPTPGAIARQRLQELRRAQPYQWEIRPGASDREFGTEQGVFHDVIPSRPTTQSADGIRISGGWWRLR